MEPERDIEKLLRKFARKRREDTGAPSELHPATRRMLQSEVARRISPPRQRNFLAALLAAPRARFGLATGAVALALVALGLVFFAVEKRDQQLASAPAASPIPPAEAAPEAAAAPAAAVRETGGTEEKAKAAEEVKLADRRYRALTPTMGGNERLGFGGGGGTGGGGGGADLLAKAPAAGVAPSSRGSLDAVVAENSALVTNGFSLTAEYRDLAPTQAVEHQDAAGQLLQVKDATLALAPLPYAEPESSAANVPERDKTAVDQEKLSSRTDAGGFVAAASQRFVQVDAAGRGQADGKAESASRVAAAVLNAFKLEQDGQQIRMVDNDGSVYSGSLQATGEAESVQPSATQKAFLAKNASGQATKLQWEQNYIFRVAGTNRSLKRNVEFNGNLLTVTDAAPGPNANKVVPPGQSQLQAVSNQLQFPLANCRISGMAVIDNQPPIQINAVPATP